MSSLDHDAAVERLTAAVRDLTATTPLTEHHGHFDIPTAYDLQARVVAHRLEQGHRVIGAKLGLTSEAKQKQMNVDEPLYGWLTSDMRVEPGSPLIVNQFIQPRVEAEIAFLIGEDFLAGAPSCLVLGDNIFHGTGLTERLRRADAREHGATVFGYWVKDPERYGVAAFDADGKVVDIEEKPAKPRSNYAVTGLYFYDQQVCDIAADIKPSPRGELEITDVNRRYLELNQLNVEIMGRGYAWLDTGTHDSLLEAAGFIATLQKRQGLMVACPEEIAFHQKWISAESLQKLAQPLAKNGYGQYLLSLLK